MPTSLFAPSEPRESRLRILVADDNHPFRMAIGGLLGCLGHLVELVTNGQEAVEAACLRQFDLVLLDIQMPEMGGFEVARLLRGGGLETSSTRIIGLSAQEDYRHSSEVDVMDGFLVKPVRLADLVRLLGPGS